MTNPLAGLQMRRQWVTWKLVQRNGDPKPTKIPYNPQTGEPASSTDPTTWVDYEQALTALGSGHYSGVGFVFTDSDPFAFVDVDGCRDPETGAYTPDAVTLCQSIFPGAAMEVSQSGSGIHIIGTVDDKESFKSKRKRWVGHEFYTTERFIALGNLPDAWQGDASVDITSAARNWVPDATGTDTGQTVTGDRDPRWCGPEDDDELIRRMLADPLDGDRFDKLNAAASADPNDFVARVELQNLEKRAERKWFINALWSGNPEILGQNFPSDTGKDFDHSAADMSLMSELSFWTGGDADRMIRLFSRSALGQRDKWVKRNDYRVSTVRKPLANLTQVYRGNRSEQRAKIAQENRVLDAQAEYQVTTDILTTDEMIERLYFIRSGSGNGAIADVQSGKSMSMSVARVNFAASKETIEVVDQKSGKTKAKTVPALDMWASSPHRKSADRLTWVPGGALDCDVPGVAGAHGFNTWRGIPPATFQQHLSEDAPLRNAWLASWHEHIAYLFPIESERRRFEQWCAHIIQKPDELPQTGWCLIATQTGIGRNWLGSVLHRVIRGHVLGNAILDSVLSGNFNGLMSKKLLIVVDEARAGMRGTEGWQNAEKLKTMVNAEYRTINEKHGLETIEQNAMRWLTFSNHFDALPIEPNDRRWNFVANPTIRQRPEYYRHIYDVMRRAEFIAAVRVHLETLDLTGFHAGDECILNDARARVLQEVASDTDIHAADFREMWPAQVAKGSDFKQFMSGRMGSKCPSEKILYKVAQKSGMAVTARVGRDMTRFVVVDQSLAESDIAGNAAQWLKIAEDAHARFTFTPVG